MIVDIGYPGDSDAPAAAHITTNGETIYFTATDFTTDDLFDSDRLRRTTISVGPAATPPAYDQRSSSVVGATAKIVVPQNTWIPIDLPAGDYWVLSARLSTTNVASCTAGGVTGSRAARTAPSPTPSNS
ncbi:hypothetical protein [Virgisporangium aliadipatigenens]|uniref:hypothetical protein n=1 Tax=Virgisporangium aliadipatigenens TaxID=741659 RepID=UPI00194402A7|nr:hypothetical protein [Virgisporangium aliadipatigenens]